MKKKNWIVLALEMEDDIFSLDLETSSTSIPIKTTKPIKSTPPVTQEVIDLVSDDDNETFSLGLFNSNIKQAKSSELNSPKRTITDDAFDLDIGTSQSFSFSAPKRQKTGNEVNITNNNNNTSNGVSIFG